MNRAPVLQGFTREYLAELFEYKPRLGLLVRRVTRAANARKGDAVGTIDGKGYLHVNILGKFVRVHRICFFLRHGWVPPDVDHEDRNRLNNRSKNLRPATRQQNVGNTGLSRRNKSGFKGVSFNTKRQTWAAQIKINGKQTGLGHFTYPEAAARAYDRAALKHFGEHAFLNHA